MTYFKLIIIMLLSALALPIVAGEYSDKSTAIKVVKGIDTSHNDPYIDLDEDGVVDQFDFCPNSMLGFPVNRHGCEPDTDRDGVFDRVDQCPNSVLGMRVNRFGCEADDDRDGVLNSVDECPNTIAGTMVDVVGCMLVVDKDGDGVNDLKDQCPNTREGVAVNEVGCELKDFVITKIIFDTGSYDIRADQRTILVRDITELKNADIDGMLVITGHTDSVGTVARNEQLSWNRAQSIKNYLVKEFNYAEDRILVLGLGESVFRVNNDTAENRQVNRRIEFSIVEESSAPVGAVKQMPASMEGYIRFPVN